MTRETGYLITEYTLVTVEPVVQVIAPPSKSGIEKPDESLLPWAFGLMATAVLFAIGYGAWFCWTFYPYLSAGSVVAVAAITAGIFYKKRRARANKRDVVT